MTWNLSSKLPMLSNYCCCLSLGRDGLQQLAGSGRRGGGLISQQLEFVRYLNANRAVITRAKRPIYTRRYPTLVVLPDGATITTNYHEPRRIIKLPVKFDECSPEMQKYIRLMRQPKVIEEKEADIVTSFDPRKYL